MHIYTHILIMQINLIYVLIYTHVKSYRPDSGIMDRVFDNGGGDQGSIPGRVILKTQKNDTLCFLS